MPIERNIGIPVGIIFQIDDKIILTDMNGEFLSKEEMNSIYMPSEDEMLTQKDKLEKERTEMFERMNKINNTKTEINKRSGYVYIIKSQNKYKIGKASKIKDRIKKYITENPEPIEIILTEKVSDYTNCESELHKKLSHKNYNREWFELDDSDFIIIKTIIEKYKL